MDKRGAEAAGMNAPLQRVDFSWDLLLAFHNKRRAAQDARAWGGNCGIGSHTYWLSAAGWIGQILTFARPDDERRTT